MMKNKYEDLLLSECNHYDKGFINLLRYYNETLDVEFQNNYSIKSSIVKSHLQVFGTTDIEVKKLRYFFRHLLTYFDIMIENDKELTNNDKVLNIFSSISAYLDNPFKYFYTILNRNLQTQTLVDYSRILKSDSFIGSFSKQVKKISYNSKIYMPEDFEFPNATLKNKLYNILSDEGIIENPQQMKNVIEKICSIYEEFNKSDAKLEDLKNKTETIDEKTKVDLETEDTTKKNDPIDLSEEINKRIIDTLFNPDIKFIKDKFAMYDKFAERLQNLDDDDCRKIKTIIYGLSYFLKDTDIGPSTYVNNIINANQNWAVGTEHNNNPSFYGKSDLAKYLYAYYPFMTAEENPYRDIINNKTTREMDYNAILLQKYFKDHGVLEIGLSSEKLNDVYSMLKNLRELIAILDEPIVIKGVDISSFIMGIVNTIMNAATITLDFSVSRLVKELFYLKIIPINDNKYSVGDLYNYLTFINLILKQVDTKSKTMNVSYISKEELVEKAFDVLGVNENKLEKTGYGAYDSAKNHFVDDNNKEMRNTYFESLFKNPNDNQFILKRDMKLLYSLIQFGIQKRVYKTGDKYYEYNFSFGNEYQVKNILESLTKQEIFFIFSIYEQNMYSLKDKIADCSYDNIIEYNKKLLDMTSVYDHSSRTFYEIYIAKDQKELNDKIKWYDFEDTKYDRFISAMYNEYRKILKYNKNAFEKIVFSANNISDVDDFLVRFIPSITEMLKTLGQDNVSLEKITEFIDQILFFVSDTLFRELFLGVKKIIKDLVRRFSGNFFENIKSQFDNMISNIQEDLKDVNAPTITFDLAFGDSRAVKTLDKIIRLLELGKFDLFNIQDCFSDYNLEYSPNNGYDPFYNDSLIFNGGTSDLGNIDLNHNSNNELFYGKDKVNITIHNNKKPEKIIYGNKLDNVVSNSKKQNLTDNKKIIYDKGEILIEKHDGTKVTLISKDDYFNKDKSFIKYPEKVEQNLSKDEYKQLIEIRDHITNLTNYELSNLNKQLNKLKEQLKIEMNKQLPNYNIIKDINKKIMDLTSHIDDVKTKNRILEFDNDSTPIIIKDFDSNKTSKDEKEYINTLDSYFKQKKTVLEEVDKIVAKSPTILTNYQITELLK